MERKYYTNGVTPMATQTIPRDLGLDLRKLPDLTDSATRKRLSPAAIEAVLKISEKWGLKSDDAMLLLGGISNGRYYGLKKSRKGPLTQDELTRVSLLIGIFKALNILFSEKLANQWVSRPNSNPMFKNQPPLVFLIQGGMPGMLAVRRLLDGRRGGR
jgi:uncharacterized protein (DUF2384 family)